MGGHGGELLTRSPFWRAWGPSRTRQNCRSFVGVIADVALLCICAHRARGEYRHPEANLPVTTGWRAVQPVAASSAGLPFVSPKPHQFVLLPCILHAYIGERIKSTYLLRQIRAAHCGPVVLMRVDVCSLTVIGSVSCWDGGSVITCPHQV